MEKHTIGENIIRCRKSKGITQKKLAELTHMTPSNLFKIERGDVTPKADTLKKIMDALQITPNQIFGVEQYENIHRPERKKEHIKNRRWMDTLEEEKTLLYLAGLLYHYDVIEHNESFEDAEWRKAFRPIIEYVEEVLGCILFDR